MKTRQRSQSTTSLPRAPQDDVTSRMKHYAITMGIRTVCFLLMALVTPYGWYTWVFGAAAIVLPYVAVVFANNAAPDTSVTREQPQQQLEERPVDAVPDAAPNVVRIQESGRSIAATPPEADT